ncbi:MAG: hypothetical protein HW374_1301 [Bacteroidetes bacterium]|nr:hypothetical protein [Bacteroidota bacterium]
MDYTKLVGLFRLMLSCCLFLLAFGSVNGQDEAGTRISQTKQTAVTYQDNVLPILTANCNTCHFPGGKVYDEYPFDDQKTVATLGKKLFTRIKDEEQQATITLWLKTVSSKPDSSAPRRGKKH